jgi:transposase
MSKQPTRRQRLLERQRTIDRHRALGQLDEQGRAALPARLSGEDRAAAAPAGNPRRFIRPQPESTA